MSTWKLKLHLIAEELFQFLLITYLVLLLIEVVQEGFVSYFFNLSILLGIIALDGLVIVMTRSEKLVNSPNLKRFNKSYTIMLIIGSCLLVYFSNPIHDISTIIITLVTAVILTFLSLLIYHEDK